MRIALLGCGEMSGHAGGAYRGLVRCGHDVTYISTGYWQEAMGAPYWWQETVTALNLFKPDLIVPWMHWKHMHGSPGPILALKQIAPIVYFSSDDPDRLYSANNVVEWKHYDAIWSCCADSVAVYQKEGVSATVVYPPVVDNAAFRPQTPSLPLCDFGFICTTLHEERPQAPVRITRRRMLSDASDLGSVIVVGLKEKCRSGFRPSVAFVPEILPERQGEYISRARINLNHHLWPDHEGYLNRRTFEILACGGFQLCDDVAGIDKMFKPGVHLALYHDESSFIEVARYWLLNPTKRLRIARQGHEFVMANYRVEQVMERAIAWTRKTLGLS